MKDRERITGSGLLDVFSCLEVTIVSDKTKSKGRSSRRGNRLALFGWVHSRWESKLDERLLSERGRQLSARLCSGSRAGFGAVGELGTAERGRQS